MEKNTTLCAQVREQYGDTQEAFAVRLGMSLDTVRRWEEKGLPNMSIGHALLLAAQKGTFPATPPRFADSVERMTAPDVLSKLQQGYGDSAFRFARRVGVNYATLTNWQNGVFKFSTAAKRLFRHVMEHPEEFIEHPAAFERVNVEKNQKNKKKDLPQAKK